MHKGAGYADEAWQLDVGFRDFQGPLPADVSSGVGIRCARPAI
jgi:hypothetical protein